MHPGLFDWFSPGFLLPRSNLSAGRLLNLKDRLSSEALQATLKVFRIKPPTGAVKEEEKVERDVVPPFALTKDSLMPKVSYPHTYFSKKKLANFRIRLTSKRVVLVLWMTCTLCSSSVSLKTKARTMKKVVLDIPHVPNTDIVNLMLKVKENYYQSLVFGYCVGQLLLRKLAGKGLSVKNDAADSDFLQQLDYLNQVTKSWSSAELVNLLIQLIEASYATSSESILPMIKADIGVKVAHVQNIYELPDFVLLKMFSYLDVGSLRNCQEVCRRWRFLCSQPIIWKDKCQKLGNKYNMHNLCASIAKELDGKHLDWQTIYLELENRLRRLYDPPVVNLHPAVMAKKVGAEPLAAVPCQPLIMLASDPPQEVSDGSVDTPTSTLNVSNSTSSPHSETESMIGAHPVSLAAKSKKVFHKSKFPHLKLSNQELVWVTDSPVKGGQDDSKEQKADVRLKVSAKLKNSADSDTQKDSTLPAQQLPSRNDSLTASEDRKGDKSQPGVALDLRTNLQPAVQLDKTSLDMENVLCTNGVARSCNQVVNSSTLAKSSHASQPFLEWLPLSEYNPTDISTRRIVGFVKPVSYVHKFKGHLDEIYCCAFDKNRVFTGGVDAHIFLWDIRTGRYVQKLDYHTGSIRSLELDSEDDILYSASWDTTVVIWDAIKFEVKACLTGHSAAVVEIKLCKAKHIICSASTDGTVRTWCTDTYSNIQVLRDHVANINCVYYDGMDIASGGADRAVHVYSHCRDQPETKYAYKGHCSAGHTLKSTISIGRIALSTAQSWNKTDQNKYSANSVTSILVINDLIVGGTSHGEIICWSKIALTVVARFDLHMGSITSINLWCSRLLTCGSDGVIKETDLATMTCVRQLNDHFTSIHCMKVNERLERIVSVGEDKLVHVWHFAKNKKRSKSESEGTVRCLALPSPVFKVDLQGETKTSRVKQRPPK
ncbi:hypothetical protein EB796_021127 [Bugula neritina]|uniref:F-box domain-containing protein n=1 Tax=Bugula neritina TaxID=10212 RepID=A0A7J7J313_BUGNE|nr:hypothetical protein EB796_021127 [Bugula neritina]